MRIGSVAAVELMGDVAVLLGVFRQIGVQQIKRDMAHFCLPDLSPSPCVCGKSTSICTSEPFSCNTGDHRQVFEIRVGVGDLLVALSVDGLGEISLPIEQADANQRQAQVARRLAMISGQDAETARINRKALMEAELETEIRHQVVRSADPLA